MLNSTKRDAATNTVVNADGTWINKKARISSTNNFADLPSDDWFVQSFGPLPVSSSNSNTANLNKRKKPLKNKVKQKKIKKSNQTPSTSELVQLEVSDGEDIFEAFPPVSSLKNQKEEKTVIRKEDKSEKKNKTSNSVEDDDLDFVILFESIGGKTPVKEETISSDLSDSDEDNLTTSTNQLKKSKVNLKPTSRSTTKTTVEERFGVTSSFSKQILEHLAQNLKKFPKEFEAFNTSIWTHFTENLQNDHTYVWKMRVKNILDEIIKELFPNDSTSLVAVGSTVNGCGAFNSDMDLCLCMPCEADGYDTRRSYAINRLRKVMRKLMNRKSLIHDIQYIPAKVPILKIKFKHPYQKLEVDINVNNVPGIYNSYLIHYYSRIDDRFPALCLVAKHWAKKKGILDACSGFFNSYSLILMVLHFLQCGLDTPILPNLQFLYPEYFHFHRPLEDMKLFNELPTPIPEIPKNNLSVGELLIAFFHYYNNFDFEEYAISVNRGSVYPRSELSRSTMRFKIFIEEPFDFKNTARCVTNEECYEEILNKFREAVGLLKCPPNLKKLIS